jgi:Flp pilus assembly protein TadG
MLMRLRNKTRRGGTLLEFAMVAPVTFLLLLGLLIGGMGVFRFQQVAHLARDAARWASVHGTQYATDTGNAAATATDVYNQVIYPNAAGLDLSHLTYSVTWNTSNSPSRTTTVNNTSVVVANTVTVTISYQWIPELYFGGTTFSSSSTAVMNY